MESSSEVKNRQFDRSGIAARLRSIREEIYGVDGAHELAVRLGLPPRTWLNYERGVTIPGEVMLRFLVLTGAEPLWVSNGVGARYVRMEFEGRQAVG